MGYDASLDGCRGPSSALAKATGDLGLVEVLEGVHEVVRILRASKS
jgi:hypothetical protein